MSEDGEEWSGSKVYYQTTLPDGTELCAYRRYDDMSAFDPQSDRMSTPTFRLDIVKYKDGGTAGSVSTSLIGNFQQAAPSPSGEYHLFVGELPAVYGEILQLYTWFPDPDHLGSVFLEMNSLLTTRCAMDPTFEPEIKEEFGSWRSIHFFFDRWHEEEDWLLLNYVGRAPYEFSDSGDSFTGGGIFTGSFWFDVDNMAVIPSQ